MNRRISIGDVVIILLLGIYPFVMTDGYFNVSKTKYMFFAATILITSIGMVVKFYYLWMKNDVTISKEKLTGICKKFKTTDKWLVAYFICTFISFILSDDRQMTFTGYSELYMGFSLTLMNIALYLVIRCSRINKQIFLRVLQISACVVVGIAVFQFMGVDFFHMLARITSKEQINYLSTWGNTCIYGIYIVLLMPVVACQFCFAESENMQRLSGVTCFFLYIGVLTSNTDATYLGVFVGMLCTLIACMWKRNALSRFANLLCLFGFAGLIFQIVYKSVKTHRAISSMGKLAMSLPWCILLILLGVIVWGLVYKDWLKEHILISLAKVIKIGAILCVAIVLVLMIYFTVFNQETPLGKLENYLRFSESWGTERGYIWKLCMEEYLSYPLIQKLFGIGQGAVSHMLMYNYSEKMLEEIGYYFNNAHNVYIHQLLSIGIAGVVAYVGLLVSTVKAGVKCVKDSMGQMNTEHCILLGGVIAIFACGFTDIVSIMQPLTMPIWWIIFSLTVKYVNIR